MDFDLFKEEIKNKLKEKNCLTREEMTDAADGDETLVDRVCHDLISEEKIAIGCDNGSLQCILDPAKEKDAKAIPEIQLVFISYGHECKGIKLAYRLCKDLEERANYNVWIDAREIHEGDSWDARVEEGIERSRTLLAVLTPHSTRKESVCRDEIHFALLHEKNIIPLKGDPDPKATQLRLVRRHYLDFSKDANYEVNFQRLVRALSGDQSGLIKPIPKIADEEPFDFGREISLYSNNFTGREWVKEEIDAWLSNPDDKQIFLITGDIGSGKSAIAAWLSQIYTEQAVGIHFCLRNSEKNFPTKFVISIAAQLSEKLKGYKEILEQKDLYDAGINASDAFRRLIIDPVCSRDLVVPDKTLFLIVDALDEAKLQKEGSETIFSIIDDQSKFLPSWLRIVATTRPKRFIKDVMRGNSRVLDMKKKRRYHDNDIRNYLEEKFSGKELKRTIDRSGAEKEDFIEAIIRQSKGNFLYAVLAVNYLSEGDTPHRPEELPPTISGFFLKWFEQLFPHDEDFEKIRPVLEVICFAREPLSAEEIALFCGKSTYDVKKLLLQIEDFIPLDEAKKYQAFHISFLEWLKGELGECEKYSIDPDEGRRMLADGCYKEYTRGIPSMKPYTQKYIALHLLEAGQEDRLAEVLADPVYFVTMWKKDEFTFKANWVQIEKRSNLRIPAVYEPVLRDPAGVKNDEFIFWLSEFFDDIERRKQAISLFEYLIHQYIENDEKEKLQNVLSSVAFSLYLIGKSGIALQALKISEYLSRALGDLNGLQKSYFYHATIGEDIDTTLLLFRLQQKLCEGLTDPWARAFWLQLSYGNEGLLLSGHGHVEQALKLFRLKEEKSQEMGIKQGLQWAYGWQASELYRQGKYSEALELFKAQEKIAEDIGYKRGLENSLIHQRYIFDQQGDTKQLKKIDEKVRKLQEPDEVTTPDFDYQKILDHLKEFYTSRVHAGREHHGPGTLIQDLGILALVYEIEGDMQKSLMYLQEQEGLCRKYDQTGTIISLLMQLRVLAAIGEYEQALDACQRALKQERSYGDTVELHISLLVIGKKLRMKSDHRGAFVFLRETWDLFPKTKDMFNELASIRYLDLIASVMYENGRFHDAIAAADALETIASQGNDLRNLEYAIAYQGLSYEAQGDFEKALSLYTRQAHIPGEGRDTENRAWPIKNQGDVLRKLGNLDAAMEKYQEQKNIAEKDHSIHWLVDAIENLGSIRGDTGDLDHALEYYCEEESIARKDSRVDVPRALERQGRIWLRKGDLGRALDHFKEMENLLGATDNFESLARSIGYQAGILHARGEITRSLELMEKKRRMFPGLTPEDWHAKRMNSQDEVHHLAREIEQEYRLFLDDAEFLQKSSELPAGDPDPGYRSLLNERMKKFETSTQDIIDYFTSLEQVCERTGFQMGLQYAAGNKGLLCLMQGRVAEASAALSRMEEICNRIGYRYGLQLAYSRQADLALTLGQYEKARDISIKQEHICREMNLREDLGISFGRQALLRYQMGNYPESLELFRKQEAISSELGLLYWQQKSVEGQGLVHLALHNTGDALKVFLAKEKICRLIGDPRLICVSLMHQKHVYDLMGDTDRSGATVNEIDETVRLFT
jgi:tetratricopeptide (TPR) repeat protein